MIQLSTLGVWGGFASLAPPYLNGNAKVYDGSFDWDRVEGFDQFDVDQASSILIAFEPSNVAGFEWFFTQGDDAQGNNAFYGFALDSLNNLRMYYRTTTSTLQNIIVQFSLTNAKHNMCFCYDGSGNTTGFTAYLDGVEISLPITPTAITGTWIHTTIDYLSIGAKAGTSFYSDNIRRVEWINREATSAEGVAVTNLTTGGSFGVSGIGVNQYRLAVDFNKTNGNPPATFDNTPSYTITSLGGATYTPY